MKLTPLSFCVLLAACAAPDDDAGDSPAMADPTGDETGDDAEQAGRGRELAPVWSSTDFGRATFLNVGQLDFGPDNSLVVGSTIDDRSGSTFSPRGRIDRYSASGRRQWTVELAFDEFADDLPLSGTFEIFGQAVHLASIDHKTDGTILVGFGVAVDFFAPTGFSGFATRNYIRSYAPNGHVLGTIELGGITEFPTQDSVDELGNLNFIRALPDGSIAWTGYTSRGAHPILDDILVTEGSVGLLSASGQRLWTVTLGQELDIPNMVFPSEEIMLDVLPTLDGDLAVRGHFHGVLTIGDLRAEADDRSSFFARVSLDGTPTWLGTLPDSEPIGGGFAFPGMGLDSNGNTYTASYLFEDNGLRLVAIDPNGEISTDVALEDVESLTVVGDDIAIGGNPGVTLPGGSAFPARIEVRRPDGTLVGSRSLAPERLRPAMSSRVFTITSSDDGRRIAAGGTFNGAVDLGQGTVRQPAGVDIAAYVGVFRAPSHRD